MSAKETSASLAGMFCWVRRRPSIASGLARCALLRKESGARPKIAIGTLAQLRSEGKIRLIGLSNVTQEHIDRARRIVPIVSVQNRYSLADREWDYLVDHCELNGIAFIPWFPLAAGRMADKILNQVARAHGASVHQVALAWLFTRSPIMLLIPGTSSVKHLEENVAAAALRLSDEEYATLSRVPQLAATRQ